MQGTEIAAAFRRAIEHHRTDQRWLSKKEEAWIKNKWFEQENTNQALDQWLLSLQPEHVSHWLEGYKMHHFNKTVGIIMAGNIPLVGMHDLLSCLVSGFKVRVKASSDDEVLPKFWVSMASEFLPGIAELVEFSENLKEVDAAIATGSNNSSRYFEYYFRNKPHLLRKNRNSVSVLSGDETSDQLAALGRDVFDFFGLGCRNVTHLYLPAAYPFKPLFDAWEPHINLLNHNKYANNYNYHKALLLMNLDPHMDTGYVLLKEREDIYSPVGMLNYTFYSDLDEVREVLKSRAEEIQCVTSEMAEISNIRLGDAQRTMLWDYADGLNTLDWLSKIH